MCLAKSEAFNVLSPSCGQAPILYYCWTDLIRIDCISVNHEYACDEQL